MQSAFNFLTSLISIGDGLMNKLVRSFTFLNFLIIFSNLLRLFFIFKPPSVVISFLFSGTKQIKFGLS